MSHHSISNFFWLMSLQDETVDVAVLQNADMIWQATLWHRK